MNVENYTSITKHIGDEKIGVPKVIRVYKNKACQNAPFKDAVYLELYEDIKFICTTLGDPALVYAKTVNYENTIIIVKHKNNAMSHIALNLFSDPILETFRVEIAGDKGLIDYDSDHNMPLFYHNQQPLTITDYSNKKEFLAVDDENAIALLDSIMSKLSSEVTR